MAILILLLPAATALIKINTNELDFTPQYSTKEIPVTDTGIMIKQENKPYGNIDYIAVRSNGQIFEPTSAKQKGKSVLNKLRTIDNDVIDLHEPIQITLPTTGMLIINANEHLNAEPVRYPLSGYLTLEVPPGSFTFDGTLDANLGSPAFQFWWEPVTGHPAGNFIAYLRGDENNIYLAFDVTPDNTNDVKEDWAAVHVQTQSGENEYYADHAKKQYGLSSFGYSSPVNYEHRFYEFRIPREEITPEMSTQSDTISLNIQYYGTAGAFCGNNIVELPEECDDGNNDNGDGCSAICTIEAAAPEFSSTALLLAVLVALGGIFAVRKIR